MGPPALELTTFYRSFFFKRLIQILVSRYITAQNGLLLQSIKEDCLDFVQDFGI